jgi:hypothetical protein
MARGAQQGHRVVYVAADVSVNPYAHRAAVIRQEVVGHAALIR